VKESKCALNTNGGYRYVNRSCVIRCSPPGEGKTLLLSAWALSSEPKSTHISVGSTDRKDRSFSIHHPADGHRHLLRAMSEFPEKNRPRSLVAELNHRREPQRPCYYDGVQVAVVESRDSDE